MTESVGNVEYVGIGKPEPMESAREHPAVKAVKGALRSWWERVGPGGVEKSWVNAHKNILKHIDGDGRQQAFARSEQIWRRIGKALGVTSTVLDFGIGGLGLVLLAKGWQKPSYGVRATDALARFAGSRIHSNLEGFYATLFNVPASIVHQGSGAEANFKTQRGRLVGRAAALVPGAAGIGVLIAGGPAHLASGIGAKVIELFGTVGVHGGNYVASGKASEHAKTVGGALGKGAEAAVKYAAEHPGEIRKTMRTVEEIRKDREREGVAQELRRKREAEAQLQREYTMWMDSLDGSLRSYYEQNHQWPPPMADFLKERKAFLMDIQKQQ